MRFTTLCLRRLLAVSVVLALTSGMAFAQSGVATADLSGFRLVDARASYGIGLQTFALGFPMHFDWSWRTLFNKQYEDLVFFQMGGSEAFRKPKFSFWIGYDF